MHKTKKRVNRKMRIARDIIYAKAEVKVLRRETCRVKQ